MSRIDEYEYVSFDIFDTLVKRNVENPTDIFYVVEKKLSNTKIRDFAKLRIEAQRKARSNSESDEITLEEIYDNIDLDDENRILAKKTEIETEIEFCQFNKDIANIYNEAIENNCKIIIISDMYLDEEIIIKILEKCGISYFKLFVSSKVKKRKSTRKLFKYVLEKLAIKSNQIIHIGDNYKSDYVNARLCGIKSILYRERHPKYSFNEENQTLEYNILKAFIRNNCDNKSYFYQVGYKGLGPLLFGFCNWLHSNVRDKTVYFLSRDGRIIKDVYDKMYPTAKTIYLYASRRSTIIPSLWKYNSFDEIISIMHIGRRTTASKIFQKMGVDILNSDEIFMKYGLDINKEYLTQDIKNNNALLKLFDDYFEVIKNNSREEYKNLLGYYGSVDFSDEPIVVDIGWNGNIQNALARLFPQKSITGYYIGLNPDNIYQGNQRMYGYLFEKGRGTSVYEKEKYFNLLLEFMFMTNHGSVKRFVNFENNDSCVEFEDYEYEEMEENEYLEEIHSGAMDFVNEYSSSFKDDWNNIITLEASFLNIIEMGINPRFIDIKKYGNIRFEGKEKIICDKSPWVYFLNPKSFLKDYKNSQWRIGFLKKYLLIPIDYYRFNEYIRKKYLRRGM